MAVRRRQRGVASGTKFPTVPRATRESIYQFCTSTPQSWGWKLAKSSFESRWCKNTFPFPYPSSNISNICTTPPTKRMGPVFWPARKGRKISSICLRGRRGMEQKHAGGMYIWCLHREGERGTPKPDAVRKPSKGGCGKMQTGSTNVADVISTWPPYGLAKTLRYMRDIWQNCSTRWHI